MKKILTAAFILFTYSAYSQQSYTVDHFDKVLVGPHIELILEEGNREKVDLSNVQVEESEINVKVEGRTLYIYLDEARFTTKHKKVKTHGYKTKEPVYRGTKATATVTYNYLSKLSLRGEESHKVKGTLDSDKLIIKMYGEAQLQFESIDSETIKAKLYGDNLIEFEDGKIRKQKYKSYGENVIDARRLQCSIAKSTNYGESKIRLHASEKIKFSSLGESSIEYSGVHKLRRGIILGDNEMRRISQTVK
jgi:hypothetical protein